MPSKEATRHQAGQHFLTGMMPLPKRDNFLSLPTVFHWVQFWKSVATRFSVAEIRSAFLFHSPLTMTETKKGSSPYTAGPWIQTWQIDPDSEPVIAVTTQKNEVIAMVYPDGHPDEVEANASLIAAAPELLAALKGSTVFIEQALTDLKGREETATYRDFWNRLQAARNAIAKTEGKDFPTAGW